jgi:hypothetical protein
MYNLVPGPWGRAELIDKSRIPPIFQKPNTGGTTWVIGRETTVRQTQACPEWAVAVGGALPSRIFMP